MVGDSFLTSEELLSCMELGKALTAELDPKQLLGTILHKMSALLPAHNWSLLLLDETTNELRFEVSVGLDLDVVKGVRLPLGQGIAGQVALQQQPMIIPDVRTCEFFAGHVDEISGARTESIICVPLVFGGRSLGVIEVVNPQTIDSRSIAVLKLIADYAAIAVENTRRYSDIRTLAIQDGLTGLYNTRHLYEDLADLIPASAEHNEPFSLIFMDIDNFKSVVDTYGHLNGSQAIQEVAQTIRECLSGPAYGVSYGGDEFVVVLPGFGKQEANRKAEEIRSRMAATVYLANQGHHVSLQASFGVATYPDDATDRDGLLALADQAMFDVKGEGKNAVKST
jgi:diguanylate cyclase (GGDEF)-like protein